MYGHNRFLQARALLLTLAMGFFVSCAQYRSAPIPQPKPPVPVSGELKQEPIAQGFADAIADINEARIHLAGQQPALARPLIQEARATAYRLAFDEQAARDVAGELRFSHNGMRSWLYIPPENGQMKAPLERALSQLAGYNIEPDGFRLISFPRSISPIPFGENVAKADELLRSKKPDESDMRAADRELEYVYRACKAGEFTGDPAERSRHYLAAADLFLVRGHYALSRDTLQQADKAVADQRLEENNGEREMAQLSKHEQKLTRIEQKLEKKDPSLLNKLGRSIDGLFEGLIEK